MRRKTFLRCDRLRANNMASVVSKKVTAMGLSDVGCYRVSIRYVLFFFFRPVFVSLFHTDMDISERNDNRTMGRFLDIIICTFRV